MGKDITRYSEAFKLKVVKELEEGKFKSIQEARELYGIFGGNTVQLWLKKYGKNNLLGKVVIVQTANEKSEIKKLQAQNKQLEKALARSYIELRIEQEYVKIICEKAKIENVEDLKKKVNLQWRIE